LSSFSRRSDALICVCGVVELRVIDLSVAALHYSLSPLPLPVSCHLSSTLGSARSSCHRIQIQRFFCETNVLRYEEKSHLVEKTTMDPAPFSLSPATPLESDVVCVSTFQGILLAPSEALANLVGREVKRPLCTGRQGFGNRRYRYRVKVRLPEPHMTWK
jgi:hypothetical protein